jgi:glycosyltransferase involved in cell wall biosynthesis
MPYQQVVYVDAKRKVSTANYMSPMKMFEYMASQRAIISSDLPVLREVLNETNARLCPPDDVEAWIVAIRELISAPQVAAQLSQRAYQDVQEHTWQKRVQRILDTVQ